MRVIQRREGGDQADAFQADADEAFEEVHDVARVVGPVVGVVADAAGLVCRDGVTLHDPVDGGLAVDDVAVGVEGDVAQGQVGVVDDDGLVRLAARLPEAEPIELGAVGLRVIHGENSTPSFSPALVLEASA